MNVQIRATTEYEDALQIAQSLPDYFTPAGLTAIENAVKTERLFGAYLDRQMIGFATCKALNPQAVELTWMGVLPAYQGQGVGTQLVKAILAMLPSECTLCEVKTLAPTVGDEGYRRTRSFYRKLGFIPLEIIDPYPGWEPGNPCLILIKSLAMPHA